MAIPSVVSTSTNVGGGSQTISPGAGLTFAFITTEAQNLPSTLATQISHASSGWTAIVGTKGGAGFSAAGQYIYVFTKVTDGVETILTGDSGNINAYVAITVAGYDTATPYEVLTTGSGSFGGSSPYEFIQPSITTTGLDRLEIGIIAPRADSTGTCTFGVGSGGTFSSPTLGGAGSQTNLSSGGGAQLFYGGRAAAGATPTVSWQSLLAAYSGVAVGYVTLAVRSPLVYTDSGSGTVSLSGAATESKAVSDSASGTVAATGSKTEGLAHSATAAGTIALSGAKTESLIHSASASGTVALTGSRAESLVFTDALTGAILVTGSGSESYGETPTAGHRRLFATSPMLTGSPMRSAIDFTK